MMAVATFLIYLFGITTSIKIGREYHIKHGLGMDICCIDESDKIDNKINEIEKSISNTINDFITKDHLMIVDDNDSNNIPINIHLFHKS